MAPSSKLTKQLLQLAETEGPNNLCDSLKTDLRHVTTGYDEGTGITLYGREWSLCTARLRHALSHKRIPYNYVVCDPASVTNGRNTTSLNPNNTIPTLVVHDPQTGEIRTVITQSVAALEYLEEAFPPPTYPSLLPPLSDPSSRSFVRSIVSVLTTDIHPLTTSRVARRISAQFPCPESEKARADGNYEWDKYWIERGLEVVESMVRDKAGRCCWGDEVTMADLCLMPQLHRLEIMGGKGVLDEERFPVLGRIWRGGWDGLYGERS